MARIHLRHPSGMTAVVDSRGACVRSCNFAGQQVMPDTTALNQPPMSAGALLFPWPNRIRDGKWNFGGQQLQLPITDQVHHAAIHGVLADLEFDAVSVGEERVQFSTVLQPSSGYPFRLVLEIEYLLGDRELVVAIQFRNTSDLPAPWAFGAHPYFAIAPADESTLTVRAQSQLRLDAQLIPILALKTPNPLQTGARLSQLQLDDLYVGCADPTDSIAELADHTGRTLSIWAESGFDYVQIFTPPTGSVLDGEFGAVAIEPMTAPGDAFNSGVGLRWLAPDESERLRWGVRLNEKWVQA